MEYKGFHITKLNGENYFTWKIKTELLLKKEKLWTIVTDDPPTTLTPEWRGLDSSAQATIGLALEDKILVNISSCMTAKETWWKLRSIYEQTNLINKGYLLRKFYSSKYSEFNNMEDYLNGLKELMERLRSIGEAIKESHVIAVMLGGLPAHYDSIITAIETRGEKELNIEYVASKLRDEAAKKTGNGVDEERFNLAMNVSTSSKNRVEKGNIVCYGCGGQGHIQRNCHQDTSYRQRNETNRDSNRNKYSNAYPNLRSSWDRQTLYAIQQNTEENKSEVRKEVVNLEEEWALMGTQQTDAESGKRWILDSGASAHMTANKNDIIAFEEVTHMFIHTANGEKMQAHGKGNVVLKLFAEDNEIVELEIKDVLWIPELKHNLVSVQRLCDDGFTIVFLGDVCNILKGEQLITGSQRRGNMSVIHTAYCSKLLGHHDTCIHQWHRRLGHRSLDALRRLHSSGMVHEMKVGKCNHGDFCDACQLGGLTQRTFKKSIDDTTQPFRKVVSDLCGPINPYTLGGKKYVLSIIDCYSNFVFVDLLSAKSESAQSIIDYIEKGFNKFGYYPNVIRTDGGGEYCSNLLESFFLSKGITHQTTVANTSKQNGKVERWNRTLMEMTRKMMKQNNVPLRLWGEGVLTASYVHNRLKHTDKDRTPYELWHDKIPYMGHMRTFGCSAFAHVSRSNRFKLDDTSIQGIMVGYGINKRSYRIWIPNTLKILNATSVRFNENENYLDYQRKQQNVPSDDTYLPLNWRSPENNIGTREDSDRVQDLRRSTRTTKGKPADRLNI